MKNILKAKHFNSEEKWLEVWNNYQNFRSREEIETLIKNTVNEIKDVCRNHTPAYAWSGGKDSIALQIVCEEAGIKKGFCCYNELYFTESIEFFKNNCPQGIELFDSGEDLMWLKKHPAFLFPKKPHIWNIQTHLKYQPIYCDKENIDILMMGKRSQDGNFVSKDIIATNKKRVSIYCPIRNWVHEDVLCAIRYFHKQLSPLYFAEDGFHFGDTKFAVMRKKNEPIEKTWERIYKIEPNKVIESAMIDLNGARDFLEKTKNDKYSV